MNGQHTPGPWEARGLTIWEPGKTALAIAVVTQHHADCRPNARLIAAAPDLLEALEAFTDGDNTDSIDTRYERARQAVNKARGAA